MASQQRVLVMDNGAGTIKLGWAGEEKPRMCAARGCKGGGALGREA
jgi:actin-related protein